MILGREITLRGVLVGRYAVGEGSVRILLYTDALGLVFVLAKSAREERSKLRPHLQVGTVGTFTLVKGRDIWRVTGATDTTNTHFALAKNKKAQESAARVISTVRQFIRGEGNDPYFFAVLFEFLRALPTLTETTVPEAECAAVVRMLAALGYVRNNSVLNSFLEVAYDPETLSRVHSSRSALVRLINEGIAASGL